MSDSNHETSHVKTEAATVKLILQVKTSESEMSIQIKRLKLISEKKPRNDNKKQSCRLHKNKVFMGISRHTASVFQGKHRPLLVRKRTFSSGFTKI